MSELETGTDVTDQQIIEAQQVEIEKLEAQLSAVNIAIENRWQFGQDGDSWYATQYDFIDLQSSESGWGDTPVEAIINLTAAIGEDE